MCHFALAPLAEADHMATLYFKWWEGQRHHMLAAKTAGSHGVAFVARAPPEG